MAENAEPEYDWPPEKDVEDVIAGLDLATLTPDRDIESLDRSSLSSDDKSSSKEGASVEGSDDVQDSSSVTSDQKSVTSDKSGLDNVWMEDLSGKKQPIKNLGFASEPEHKEAKEKKKSSTKNPFKYLQRKMSKGEISSPLSIGEADLRNITIDTLPQHFVTKYLGFRAASGVQGIRHIRKPVDAMVKQVADSDKKRDLPLVQLTVWNKGLQATLHPKTTSREFQPHVMPIEYISYAVQDVKYYKIVAFINVTELTPKTQKVECHAYICDSATTARKLTLSVAKAFQNYAARLNGKQFQFKVDLRTPDEVKHDMKHQKKPECDA